MAGYLYGEKIVLMRQISALYFVYSEKCTNFATNLVY